VAVLIGTHPRFSDHITGSHHPEAPARLDAVARGIERAGVAPALSTFAPRPARRSELELVHSGEYLDAISGFCLSGGGAVDPDTRVSTESWDAAVIAAGAGPDAIERLDAGEADAAFLAVRPPGHHATSTRAMGFCLLNNVAVAAAVLADRGERVLIVDWDVHHGNGTQDTFYADRRVMYVSLHQYPFYPGSGSASETGAAGAEGTTINIPLPAGTTGDAYRMALDEVVTPAAEAFAPTWVVASAGFDAHRDDPLAEIELSAGDFADITDRVMRLVAPGRRLAFLEGGYDLEALARSAGACVSALGGGDFRPEPATSGHLGRAAVEAVRMTHPVAER
jgi:acetoin utilization deacetylase AcuC-like enzyme